MSYTDDLRKTGNPALWEAADHIDRLEAAVTIYEAWIESVMQGIIHHENYESDTPMIRTVEGWVDLRDQLWELRGLIEDGAS